MKRSFLFLFLLLSFTSLASAETLHFYNTNYNYGDSVNASYGSTVYEYLWAGEIYMTHDGQAIPFITYCLSLQYALEDDPIVEVKDLSTLSSPDDPNVLDGVGGKVAWLLNSYAPGVSSNTEGAALQLAIWELLYDEGFDFSDGLFRVTSASAGILSQATEYFNSIGSKTSEAFWYDTTHSVNRRQELIGQDLGGPKPEFISTIPEPGSLLLLGSGLGVFGLAFIRRRK